MWQGCLFSREKEVMGGREGLSSGSRGSASEEGAARLPPPREGRVPEEQ